MCVKKNLIKTASSATQNCADNKISYKICVINRYISKDKLACKHFFKLLFLVNWYRSRACAVLRARGGRHGSHHRGINPNLWETLMCMGVCVRWSLKWLVCRYCIQLVFRITGHVCGVHECMCVLMGLGRQAHSAAIPNPAPPPFAMNGVSAVARVQRAFIRHSPSFFHYCRD